MDEIAAAKRLRRLPRAVVRGVEVPVAIDRRARFLGLAHLDRSQAGPGLLIPRCRSVHTFGMRFRIDLVFLDCTGGAIRIDRGMPACRLLLCRGAAAVLELPAGGEVFSACP
jgi:uncharacterized membrane protein (UPF0127 family)